MSTTRTFRLTLQGAWGAGGGRAAVSVPCSAPYVCSHDGFVFGAGATTWLRLKRLRGAQAATESVCGGFWGGYSGYSRADWHCWRAAWCGWTGATC